MEVCGQILAPTSLSLRGKKTPRTYWIGDWVEPRARLYILERILIAPAGNQTLDHRDQSYCKRMSFGFQGNKWQTSNHRKTKTLKIQSLGMWHCIFGCVVPDVAENPSVFIFTVKSHWTAGPWGWQHYSPSKCQKFQTQRYASHPRRLEHSATPLW